MYVVERVSTRRILLMSAPYQGFQAALSPIRMPAEETHKRGLADGLSSVDRWAA